MNQFPIKDIMFYIFAIITLAPAIVVVTTKNIVYAAFALMVTLFGVAGLYVFLGADFLAATQLLIYVGGILVLVLFGVMLTKGASDIKLKVEWRQVVPGAIVVVFVLALLFAVIINTPWNVTDVKKMESTTAQIGEKLIHQEKGNFLLPFEIASVLLLVALIGAVLISRREVK